MKNINKFYRLLYLVFGLISTTSCEKLLEIDPPVNERPSEVIFNSVSTARAALSGAYSQLSSSQTFSLHLTVANGLAADELRAIAASARYAVLENNTYDPINGGSTTDIWNDCYTSIYRFNSVIVGLTNNSAIPSDIANQMVAEAKAMRAYCYMQLVAHFGDVPLVLSINVDETALMGRTSADEVYTQIIRDLSEAKATLNSAYVSNGTVSNRQQINKAGAATLLAKAYLVQGNWQEALNNADEVIAQSDLYSLLPGNQLADVFLLNSSEAILQLGSALNETSGYTNEGQDLLTTPTSFSINLGLTDGLLNTFERGDLRRSAWVQEVTLNGVTAFQPYKYRNYNATMATASGRFEVPTLLRLAEVYLIRAEAHAHLDNLTAGLADINILRTRAGLPALGAAVNLLEAIEQERRVELFCERGDRWLTLKRTGRVDAVLNTAKPGTWQSYAQWYPIPQTARDANPNLTQNEGYR